MTAAAPATLHRPFDADVPLCPRCAQPLRRVTGDRGSFFVTCDNTHRPDPRDPTRTEKCGQTVHVLAVDGVCFVSALTKEQFARFRRTYHSPRMIYAELGLILPSRAMARPGAVVSCCDCGTPTPIYDLYGGACRRCFDGHQEASR